MHARRKWQALAATTAGSLALLGTAGLGSGAQAAVSLHKCGNHPYTIEIPQGTVPQTYKPYKIIAKNIEVSGLSCTAAFKFLTLTYKNKTTTVPEHFKCVSGGAKYKEPLGYFAEKCTHNGSVIVYGMQGG
jgi:hypothetical protein